MLSEKEKLEEELRFLEESFQIGVITKEEYAQGKQRIELKLKNADLEQKKAEKTDKIEIKEIREELPVKEERQDEEKKEEKAALREEKEDLEQYVPIETLEPKKKKRAIREEKAEEMPKTAESFYDLDDFEIKPKEVPEEMPSIKEEKGNQGLLIFVIVIAAVAFGWLFFFASPEKNAGLDNEATNVGEEKITLENEPAQNQKLADDKVKVRVLNSEECFNCRTERMISILKTLFPSLEVQNVDLYTVEGKKLAQDLEINAVPAYIFDSNVAEAANYGKFSSAFNKIGDNFIVKSTVANANYYFRRESVPNKLDMFFQQGQNASIKAEKNVQEFLNTFKGKMVFQKHDSGSKLAKEIGINTFPAFLVNNNVKFAGVLPANIIKENFCQLNKLKECEEELSANII